MANPFQSHSSSAPERPDFQDVEPPESVTATDAPEEAGEDWKTQYDALYDQHLRLAADFDNFRKRGAQEREALMKYGAESALSRLIPVLDNLDRGMASLTDQSDAKTLFQGMTMMRRQLLDALTQLGLTRIETQGQLFDPNFHEAAGRVPTDAHPENAIVTEAQSGYMLYDRVLRPALVLVAAPASAGADAPAAAASANPFSETAPPANDPTIDRQV